MKLLGCEYTLDASKLLIYYNAEGRVDFRELVKALARLYVSSIGAMPVGFVSSSYNDDCFDLFN